MLKMIRSTSTDQTHQHVDDAGVNSDGANIFISHDEALARYRKFTEDLHQQTNDICKQSDARNCSESLA